MTRWYTIFQTFEEEVPNQFLHEKLTRGKFFLTRLSIVRIPPLVVVHKKKDTLLGTLTHQMLCQGKEIEGASNNEL